MTREIATRSILSDAKLLEMILASPRLAADLRTRFEDMQRRLKTFGALTQNQRGWAQDVAGRLGLDVGPAERYEKPAPSAWDPEPRKRRR